MSGSSREGESTRPALADSPWFWVMLFSGVGVALLLAASPKYAARQHRLEMQYYARETITRRQVEGTSEAREPGQEGSAAPPAAGELIIPLWPLLIVFTAVFASSATILWRTRRATDRTVETPPETRGRDEP